MFITGLIQRVHWIKVFFNYEVTHTFGCDGENDITMPTVRCPRLHSMQARSQEYFVGAEGGGHLLKGLTISGKHLFFSNYFGSKAFVSVHVSEPDAHFSRKLLQGCLPRYKAGTAANTRGDGG